MDWNEYFKMAIDWKKLPAYKTEPRIDSFVGYYLDSIISDFIKVSVEGIIPEFPLRLGTLNKEHEGTNYADRSYKVDFFVIGNSGINYLVEFKTDSASRRDKQDNYLKESKAMGTKALIEGVLKIADVSPYKIKYHHLLSKLRNYGLLDDKNNYTGMNKDLQIIYIQPSNPQNESNIISFHALAQFLEKLPNKDKFEIAFAKALNEWKAD